MKETVLPSPGFQYINLTDSPVFRETVCHSVLTTWAVGRH